MLSDLWIRNFFLWISKYEIVPVKITGKIKYHVLIFIFQVLASLDAGQCERLPNRKRQNSVQIYSPHSIRQFRPASLHILLVQTRGSFGSGEQLFLVLNSTQRPRIDLNKRFLPTPNTTTAWKLIPRSYLQELKSYTLGTFLQSKMSLNVITVKLFLYK